MLKLIAVSTLSLVSTMAMADAKFEAGKYNVDPTHSKVGFEIPHLVISSVEGRYDKYEGVITLDSKFEKSKVEMSVDAGSVDTGEPKRDGHLKSPDFFDVAKFPKLTFVSTEVKGSPESFKLTGDMTIHGKKQKVTWDAKYLGTVKDGYGNQKAAFEATTKISRKDFGLTWNNLVEAGPVVGDEVTLKLKLQAAKAK